MQLAIDLMQPPAIVRRADPAVLLSYGESSVTVDRRSLIDVRIAGIQAELKKSSAWQNVLAASADSNVDDDMEIHDVFSLNRVPPKRTYTARAKFHRVGRGKPMPYKLDDEE